MFGQKTVVPTIDQEVIDNLVEQVSGLAEVVGKLNGQRDALGENIALRNENEALAKRKADLELQVDRITEQHNREKREIEHKVGLHQKQVALEIDAAKRETTVAVREEALREQKDRFQEHMDFQRERFEDEVKAQRTIMEQILERLPKVTVERRFETVEHFGDTPPKQITSGEE